MCNSNYSHVDRDLCSLFKQKQWLILYSTTLYYTLLYSNILCYTLLCYTLSYSTLYEQE